MKPVVVAELIGRRRELSCNIYIIISDDILRQIWRRLMRLRSS